MVELWPSADRPYIGGSQDNSLLNLIFGYNGVGRITGNEVGSVGGIGGIASRWGLTGWNRLFLSEFGGQISWLIPAALILMAAGLWITLRVQRADLARASYLMWGGYLLVTGAVFSFAQGIIHPYYSIALAPAIGALVGAGSVELWKRRSNLVARLFLASALAGAMIAAGPLLARPLAVGVAAAALVAALAGPAAYTFDTVTTAHAGAIPSAGPAVQTAGTAPTGVRGGTGGFGPPPNGGGFPGQARAGAGGGGFLNASQPGAQLTSLLEAGAGRYRWVAATIDANSAAGYELATGEPVMAIGGFNGSDPAPTLAQFQSYVSQGQIHYFIAGGRGAGSGASSEIESWVSQHFTATTVNGATVYDLTQPAS